MTGKTVSGKTISVTPKRHGLFDVRLGHCSSVINDDELRELFAQIAHAQGIDLVQGADSAKPCVRYGDNPRAWVRSTFCRSCIAHQLREDFQFGCTLDGMCEYPHGSCGECRLWQAQR